MSMPARRLLVIDDETSLLRLVADVLGSRGVVDAAPSGTDGLAFLESYQYDAVVCDLRLPDVSGLAILERALTELRCKARLEQAYAKVGIDRVERGPRGELRIVLVGAVPSPLLGRALIGHAAGSRIAEAIDDAMRVAWEWMARVYPEAK